MTVGKKDGTDQQLSKVIIEIVYTKEKVSGKEKESLSGGKFNCLSECYCAFPIYSGQM